MVTNVSAGTPPGVSWLSLAQMSVSSCDACFNRSGGHLGVVSAHSAGSQLSRSGTKSSDIIALTSVGIWKQWLNFSVHGPAAMSHGLGSVCFDDTRSHRDDAHMRGVVWEDAVDKLRVGCVDRSGQEGGCSLVERHDAQYQQEEQSTLGIRLLYPQRSWGD